MRSSSPESEDEHGGDEAAVRRTCHPREPIISFD